MLLDSHRQAVREKKKCIRDLTRCIDLISKLELLISDLIKNSNVFFDLSSSTPIRRYLLIIFKTRLKNSTELRFNIKSHQKNSTLRRMYQFRQRPKSSLLQFTYDKMYAQCPMNSQINIFACFSPRINYHKKAAAGEIFNQSGIIFINLMYVTVYISHQQTRLTHIRSHQKLDLDCIFRPLIINSQSSF